MCKKVNYCNNRIDKCIRNLVNFLQERGWVTVGSCCGHNKYNLTVVVKFSTNGQNEYKELFSNTPIPRTRRFYKKDVDGYYFIPEVEDTQK